MTYSTNCDDLEHGHSCHKVAGYKYVGKACSKDPDSSYDYFRKGLAFPDGISFLLDCGGRM